LSRIAFGNLYQIDHSAAEGRPALLKEPSSLAAPPTAADVKKTLAKSEVGAWSISHEKTITIVSVALVISVLLD
jgi:hypothetical protein